MHTPIVPVHIFYRVGGIQYVWSCKGRPGDRMVAMLDYLDVYPFKGFEPLYSRLEPKYGHSVKGFIKAIEALDTGTLRRWAEDKNISPLRQAVAKEILLKRIPERGLTEFQF